MPKLIFGFDDHVASWVAQRIPHVGRAEDLGPYTTVGVLSEEDPPRIVAGAVFHNFIPKYGHAELTFAADSPIWATKGVIRAILSVPFEQWHVRRLSMATPSKHARAIRLIEGLGFKREGTLRHFFADGMHAAVFGMLSAEYSALAARLGRTLGEPERGQVGTEGASST